MPYDIGMSSDVVKVLMSDSIFANSCMKKVNLVGPSIAGMIANTFGYSVMWRVMVTPFFIGMFLVFFFRKRINKIEIDFASSNG